MTGRANIARDGGESVLKTDKGMAVNLSVILPCAPLWKFELKRTLFSLTFPYSRHFIIAAEKKLDYYLKNLV